MANSEAGMSSDAAQVLGGEYQVFLSFRGPDTRAGFTDFLYHDLVDAGVHVFRDDEELRVGDVIDGSLLHAINNSKIYIPIFSQTYASSRWCLWELAHIVDNVSKSEGEKNILPIFLDVEPDDIKLNTPQYENDLQKHEKKFPAEVKAWRVALAEVGKIKGLNVKSSPAKIVRSVVEMVLEKLETKQETVTKHLLGIDNQVKHLIESLDVNDPDVRLIAIFGMAGIGKTTIAKVAYNQLSSHFGKCCSFLKNVRERSSTEEGIVKLQKKLLLDVGSRSMEKVEDSAKGKKRIGETLSNKKVLVVLDDVDNKEHVKKLIGISKLYSGSRIIITTRDTTIMEVEGFIGKILRYEMQKMDDSLALQLFCQHAFGRDVPSNDFHRLSSEIVSLMGGLPLAIEVVSSLLKEMKDEELWKEALVRLRKVPEEAILEKLRISYDNLDKYQQQIFLDIACFFFNEKKTDATYIWADCDCYPLRGIKVLTERCLIKILQGEKLWMHDQLIALGRQIVREESQDGLGKQSRLWIAEEALKIIKIEERKDKVQGLQIVRPSYNIEITNEEFERLQNLKCLWLHKGTYVGDFASCQSNLRWFSWHSPEVMDFRAKNLYMDHLVVCKLDDLNFKNDSKAWDLIKRSQNLKVLSITSCYGITTIPDISRCSALERLTLANCWNLKKIESFIGNLHSLIELRIEKCSNFIYLPEEVGALVKLKHFSLLGCEGLRELPDSLGNLISLTELDLSDTSIDKLPNSLEGLVKLESFLLRNTRIREFPNFIRKSESLRVLRLSKDVSYFWQLSNDIRRRKILGEPFGMSELLEIIELPCFRMLVPSWGSLVLSYLSRLDEGSYSLEANVWLLPSVISMLKNLEELDFGCGEIQGKIPVGIGELSSLRNLNLKETYICRIPRTINKLHHLQRLNLWNCNVIKGLPKLPSSLTHLALKSESLLSVPNLSNLTNLVELELSDGSRDIGTSNLITKRNFRGIGRLSKLKMLYLDLLSTSVPPKFASLSHLEKLDLYGLDLRPIGKLPSSSWNWRNLLTLNLYGCELEDIPLGLPRLENLIVSGSTELQRLSIPSELSKLQQVHLQNCLELVEIQVVGLSHSLKSLRVSVCESLKKIGGLSYLKNLKNLQIEMCYVLTDVEGLNELESLQSLSVSVCPLLTSLIDARGTNIPVDCHVQIDMFGDSTEDPIWSGRTSKHSRQEIALAIPYKVELPFTIIFVLGAKKKSEGFGFAGGIKRTKEDVTPGSVTYRELIADVKGCGFRMERMWYMAPGKDHALLIEIKGDEQVNKMVQAASQKGFIDLYVEVGTDIRSQGAVIWASQRDCSIHLFFLLCALFLSFLLWRVFPGKPHFLNFSFGHYLGCVLMLLVLEVCL